MLGNMVSGLLAWNFLVIALPLVVLGFAAGAVVLFVRRRPGDARESAALTREAVGNGRFWTAAGGSCFDASCVRFVRIQIQLDRVTARQRCVSLPSAWE
jgi:hypothetical protein